MTKFDIALIELREKLEEVKKLANEDGKSFTLGNGYTTTIRYISPKAYIEDWQDEDYDPEDPDQIETWEEGTNNGWYSSSMSC